MKNSSLSLFLEINNLSFIFLVGEKDQHDNYKIVYKLEVAIKGIDNNRITDLEEVSDAIKKNVYIIEQELSHTFKEIVLILENFNPTFINLTGYKNLNGSMILRENITYILNTLKSFIDKFEPKKKILNIFNSKFYLDDKKVDNLPIGLFGDFYSHELTFFLIKNNDLKNIKYLFNKNDLNVKKILIKNFIEGVEIVEKNNNAQTFFRIKINKDNSNLSFFDESSFRYVENFNFGTGIILKDIEKVCSIDNYTIEKILSDKPYKDKNFPDNELFEEKYFNDGNYRKIRKKLVIDIVSARIEEINNIIFNENINIKSLKKNNVLIFLTIEDKNIFYNFEDNFRFFFQHNETHFIEDFNADKLIRSAVHLSLYGWKKEAIPITQTKNSLITRIFKSLFG